MYSEALEDEHRRGPELIKALFHRALREYHRCR